MPCFRPLDCWLPADGGQVQFSEKKDHRQIAIPCGQCIGCRIQRQQVWAFRCLAEASLHEHNWFATLTYSPDHLPAHGGLRHRDWQLFAKRVRRQCGPFRYLMCGEYGEQTLRPHYHALLFGLSLPDISRVGVRRGYPIFRSEKLSSLWKLGLVELGTVTAQSARYCATYVLKDSGSPETLDAYTGELMQLPKAYGRMSLKPGIGDAWARRYHPEVITHGACLANERRFPIPKRFKQIMEGIDPIRFEELIQTAIAKAQASPDNTGDRLAVRERVALHTRLRYKEACKDAL